MKKCIVLLSGGLDSSVMLAMAAEEKYDEVYALSFDYGQRHSPELECARLQAKLWGVKEHKTLRLDLRKIGGSSLTDLNIKVPKDSKYKDVIPSTYVPARNTIFLSFALAWAEVLEAEDIFIGANRQDYISYPDCRKEYFDAFEILANLSTRASAEGKLKFKIKTPLLFMTKKEIIEKGIQLGVDFSKTFSCYDPDGEGKPCRSCDACRLREDGFAGNDFC